jgi:hypothetical protein
MPKKNKQTNKKTNKQTNEQKQKSTIGFLGPTRVKA